MTYYCIDFLVGDVEVRLQASEAFNHVSRQMGHTDTASAQRFHRSNNRHDMELDVAEER